MPALGVPALGHRLGPLVGNEVVIDVVDVQARGVRGEHRGGQLALQRQRVAPAGDRRQPGPQRARVGEPADPGEDPGLGGDQVLGSLRRGHPERERGRRGGQQRQVVIAGPGQPGRQRGRQDRLRADPVPVGMQQHRPRIPAGQRAASDPGLPGARRPRQLPPARADQLSRRGALSSRRRGPVSRGPRRRPRLRLRLAGLQPGRCGLACLRLLAFRPAIRQLLLHCGPGQPPAHRGAVHAQPPGDLSVAVSLGAPPPGPRPRRLSQLARPAAVAHDPGQAFPQRPAMQRGHVVLGQAHHGRHRLAAEAQLAQHRHRHDESHAVMLGAVQILRLGHALQDGRGGRHHARTLPSIKQDSHDIPVRETARHPACGLSTSGGLRLGRGWLGREGGYDQAPVMMVSPLPFLSPMESNADLRGCRLAAGGARGCSGRRGRASRRRAGRARRGSCACHSALTGW